jgi:hypothetical protein
VLGDVTLMSGRPANGRPDPSEANPYEVDDGREAIYAEEDEALSADSCDDSGCWAPGGGRWVRP